MKLSLIRPKNETEDLLFSINKNCETLIKETDEQPKETLEFRHTKSKEIFLFKPSIASIDLGLDSNWMLGLTTLEVYKSFFDII